MTMLMISSRLIWVLARVAKTRSGEITWGRSSPGVGAPLANQFLTIGIHNYLAGRVASKHEVGCALQIM